MTQPISISTEDGVKLASHTYAKLSRGNDYMSEGSNDVLAGTIKLSIILFLANLFEFIFPAHAKLAFGAGILLGVILQEFVPPRSGRKRLLLLMALPFVWWGVTSFIH